MAKSRCSALKYLEVLAARHFHQRSFFLSALLYLSLRPKVFSLPFFTTIHDLHDLLFLSSTLPVLRTTSLKVSHILTLSDLQLLFRFLKLLYFVCIGAHSSTRYFFTSSLDHTRGILLRFLLFHSCSLSIILAMDSWRVAVLGDGGVGKTALAVQVSSPHSVHPHPGLMLPS